MCRLIEPTADNFYIGDKNVTSIAMEVPTSCLTDGDPVVGAWTTASVRQARVMNPFPDMPSGSDGESGAPAVEGGPWVQVSRLGNPLVNEVVIGLDKKDRFNHSEPVDDPQLNSVCRDIATKNGWSYRGYRIHIMANAPDHQRS